MLRWLLLLLLLYGRIHWAGGVPKNGGFMAVEEPSGNDLAELYTISEEANATHQHHHSHDHHHQHRAHHHGHRGQFRCGCGQIIGLAGDLMRPAPRASELVYAGDVHFGPQRGEGGASGVHGTFLRELVDPPAEGEREGVISVPVQTVDNLYKHRFRIFGATQAYNALASENRVPSINWFPGYTWRILRCSRCDTHVGWLFERMEGTGIDAVSKMERQRQSVVPAEVRDAIAQQQPEARAPVSNDAITPTDFVGLVLDFLRVRVPGVDEPQERDALPLSPVQIQNGQGRIVNTYAFSYQSRPNATRASK